METQTLDSLVQFENDFNLGAKIDRLPVKRKVNGDMPANRRIGNRSFARRSLYRNRWPNFETVFHRPRGRFHSNSLEK